MWLGDTKRVVEGDDRDTVRPPENQTVVSEVDWPSIGMFHIVWVVLHIQYDAILQHFLLESIHVRLGQGRQVEHTVLCRILIE